MRMPLTWLVASLALLSIGGCGGGGGGTSPPVQDASLGGYWEGTLNIEGEEAVGLIGLVAENGQGHFLRTDGIQYWGLLTAAGRQLTAPVSGATPVGVTFPDGTVSGTGSLTGTIIPRTTIVATLDFTTSGATVARGEMSLFFDSVYGRRSALVNIAGNYTDVSAPGSDALNISSLGVVFGQSTTTSCVINGQVRLIDPAFNAYDISVSYSGCTGENSVLNGSTFSGLGMLDYRTSPQRLVAGLQGTVSGAPRSIAFIYERT